MARTAQPAAKDTAAGAQRSTPEPVDGGQTDAAPETRACPTRMDGGTPLFQHQVTVPQCMSKQRKLYHKCYTCAHLMGRG